MPNIIDRAWDEIDVNENLLKRFRTSVFWIIWYKPWENDAEVVEFLNLYRQYLNKNIN